jgi:VWFA-related protein
MKIRRAFSLTLLLLVASIIVCAQQPQQQTQDQEDVVRISTNLVQIDAVVTDKNGNLVTDLKPEDFVITEDDKPQQITNFSYISTEAGATNNVMASPSAPVDKTRPTPPPPPMRLRPDQIKRTIALVVDDLGTSFESTYYVREALKKFVNEQMQPGDLVAIVRTSAGVGALQQFTSDKRQLYAAIERVRWYPSGRSGIGAFAPISSFDEPQTSTTRLGRSTLETQSDTSTPSMDDQARAFREEIFVVGTLGAINYVVRGLKDLPGRKAVVLFSDGLPIFQRDSGGGFSSSGNSGRVLDALRRLADLSNRSSVVIYTMDARGLQTLGLTAADDTSGLSPNQLETRLSDRRTAYFESQNGLNYLAQQTGGIFIHDTNDLVRGLRRVLNDQRGYYLIGYRPDESTFDAKGGRARFHKWDVKVKRPGLNVRFRKGFLGVPEDETRVRARTPREQILTALMSPFGAGGVPVRLTSLFGNDARLGSYMRSLLYIDARALTFMAKPDGWQEAVIDLVAITFDANGQPVEQNARTNTLRLRGETMERVLRDGIVYFINFPVKKPGAYQMRVAVRDTATAKVGSASQFIEVPDIKKNRLALSGVIVSGYEAEAKPSATTGNNSLNRPGALSPQTALPSAAAKANASATRSPDDAEGAQTKLDAQTSPAVRRFRRGMALQYGYIIYNAQIDRATQRPQLETQVRLFLDNKEVFVGKLLPLDVSKQPDLKRIASGGALQLGSRMQPGEYQLQVIVTDKLAKDKYNTVAQWIDFEIIQ